MRKMPIPAAPKIKLFKMESFRGCDFTNEPANVSPTRSPDAVNMIRESVGKVRKRTGYHVTEQYPDRINGVHTYYYTEGEELKTQTVVHAGTKIYADPETELYDGAGDNISVSRQMGDKLIILDGLKVLAMTDKDTIEPLEDLAYTPTILIAREPTGGGVQLEPVNLLSPARTVRFKGAASVKDYQLPSTEIDSVDEVKKLNSSGDFDALTEEADYTVNLTTGVVTFGAAPGVSPITGEDNIYITYSKIVDGYADKINRCDIVTLYGIGGTRDRMFLAGNPLAPNQDYYSEYNDPTYFGDLWYSEFGQRDSRIVGYSIINNALATHKDRTQDGTNIFIRTGTLMDGQAAFSVTGAYQGAGAIAKRSFGVLETEPLFLTKDGIFAVTPSDYSAERYAQNRSYYLNGKLLKEESLETAFGLVWQQMYFLALNGSVYILDGLQYAHERDDPFSRRQYEGFYWTDIPARILFERGGALCFGTESGALCEFFTDYESLSGFADDGGAIPAHWLTPEYYGDEFYNNKSFTKIAVLLASAAATGCRVWGIYEGETELLIDYDGTARHFSYANLVYSKFTYKTDRTPQELVEKIKIRKVKKVQFLFENDLLFEPFGLYEAASEFTERK